MLVNTPPKRQHIAAFTSEYPERYASDDYQAQIAGACTCSFIAAAVERSRAGVLSRLRGLSRCSSLLARARVGRAGLLSAWTGDSFTGAAACCLSLVEQDGGFDPALTTPSRRSSPPAPRISHCGRVC